MEDTNNEFLKTIRELDRLDKEDKKNYDEAVDEFAQFILENKCRQQEGEDDV